MKKRSFSAIYLGEAYKPAFGRKIYKKGFKLINIREDGSLIMSQCIISKSKTMESFLKQKRGGDIIHFKAILSNGDLLYISDVK